MFIDLNNYNFYMKYTGFILAAFFCFLMMNSKLTAQKKYYFYTGKEYGSESLLNPLTVIINGGFDITQLQSVSNRLGDHLYGRMFHNVLLNLGDPFPRIKYYGTSKFIKELFPTAMSKETAPWIPNYQLHLMGCGMLSTAVREWYDLHNFPYPWLMSATTLMTMHLLNETMETGPYEGYSVDEIADIYLFDLGGIILFSFDGINEFFSEKLNLSDWSLQASVSSPSYRINAGQFFSIKWKLPFSEDYSFFNRFGMGALFGLSKKLENMDNFSVGIGFRTKHLVDLNPELRERTIETSWQAGAFWDRKNSLLGSIIFCGIKEYFCSIDVYPGVLKYGTFSPGVWSIIGSNGNLTMGISTKYFLGIGAANYH